MTYIDEIECFQVEVLGLREPGFVAESLRTFSRQIIQQWEEWRDAKEPR